MKITIEANDIAGIKQVTEILYCSFCGKHKDFVKKIIAGPKVFICDECIELCVEIMIKEGVIKNTEVKGE